MLPEMRIGIVTEVPTYVPGSEGNITEIEPLRERPGVIEISSPEVLVVRLKYHCARVDYLEREAFCVMSDLLGLLGKDGPAERIKEKLESFRYLCGEARALLAERPAIVHAARGENVRGSACGAEIAEYLRKSFLNWAGIIASSIAVRRAVNYPLLK